MEQIQITQPTKLERLAIRKIADWITSQAKLLIELRGRNPAKSDEMLSKHIKSTQNYLERYLPGLYYDELFKEVIRSLSLLYLRTDWLLDKHKGPWYAFGRTIETILSKNITILAIPFGWKIFEAAIESKCHVLTGLKYLKLPNTAQEHVVIKLLQRTRRLKRLSLHCVYTLNVYRCLVRNCKLIEQLDIVNCHLDFDKIDVLIGLRNLRSVELYGMYKVSEEGVEKLLMCCKNLEYINPYDNIPNILERISKSKQSGKQFKLNSYDNSFERSVEQLKIFARCCPFIQAVYLHKNMDNIMRNENYLEPVKELLHLRKLELTKFSFYADRVNEVIKERGCNITQLELRNVDEIDLNSLKYINKMCPKLQYLELDCCEFVNETLVHEFPKEIETPPLMYLECFKLNCGTGTLPTSEHLHYLLTNHPRVKFIEILKMNLLQDAIASVLDKNPKNFMYLKELITSENVSMPVIELIVQNCINPPRVVTCLDIT